MGGPGRGCPSLSRNLGHSFWVYWAPFFMTVGAPLLGIPVYLKQRSDWFCPSLAVAHAADRFDVRVDAASRDFYQEVLNDRANTVAIA